MSPAPVLTFNQSRLRENPYTLTMSTAVQKGSFKDSAKRLFLTVYPVDDAIPLGSRSTEVLRQKRNIARERLMYGYDPTKVGT